MRKIINLIFIFLITAFFACKKHSEYANMVSFPNEQWETDNILQFNPIIQDTITQYSILIHIRNTNIYPYSNIYLFVDILQPDNTLLKDTVQGILADNKGNWLGKGKGRIKSNEFMYKYNIRFPQAGKYVFAVQQAMRTESLEGIVSVGMEISKNK